MSQLRQQANAVLNAMDEARVGLIIQLYDAGHLPVLEWSSRAENIRRWCEKLLDIETVDLDYWLNEWYRVV